MFLLSLTCPPSLSLSIAVSSSAIPCVQLFPPLAVPSACSPAEMQRWTVKADFNPAALGTGLGSPSSWHPAEGKRAKRAILSLQSLLHCSQQAQSSESSKLLRKDPLGLFWALCRQDHIFQNLFPSLHLAASCHFSWPVTPYFILCYIGVLIGPGTILYSKFLAIFLPY